MINKDIYIIFSKTGTVFSNVISFFTQKEFAHTSISLDPTFQTMYSFGRINPAYVLPAGFVEENLYSGVFSMFPESKCLIYKISVTSEQYNSLKKYIDKFLIDKSKYKYNVLGTATILFNKPIKREKHYFCSQFVAEALIQSGIYKTDKLPELIKPMDLLELENKSLLYTGKINEYPLYSLYSTDKSYSIFDIPHSLASAAYGKIRNKFI